MVETCIGHCFELLSSICKWYLDGRDHDKTGILCSITAFMRDFADFPLYTFHAANTNTSISICKLKIFKNLMYNFLADTLRTKSDHLETYPKWLFDLINVIDADSWVSITDIMDFDIRARMLDFILYLYVKSASVLDQHIALFGRSQKDGNYYSSNKR